MKADDEGRAMLQTVHALAPSAGLCFATGYGPTGVEGLAQRILQLAEPPCNADIILDDVSFFDNPYVDGPAARAVESVVSKHNVLYVSAAGNRRFFTREFAAEFVTAAHVEQKHLRRITSILSWTRFPDDMAPTWEGFGAPIRTGPKFLKLYLWWNQPATHMVDDLNLYIFAPNGTLLSQSTDANLISGQAQEVVFVPAGAEPLIAAVGLAAHRDTDSTSRGQNTPSLRLYFRVTNTYYTKVWPKSAKLHPAIWGHSAAKHTISVAAFNYWNRTKPASYSPPGPVIMFWDADGRGLSDGKGGFGESRLKPTLAGVDCTKNSFFKTGRDRGGFNDSTPNFCGTSAAAPNVAAILALLRQAKPSLSYDDILHLLKSQNAVWDPISGYGLLDADRTLCALQSFPFCTTLELADAEEKGKEDEETSSIPWATAPLYFALLCCVCCLPRLALSVMRMLLRRHRTRKPSMLM
mmetsp:Transcript_31206/g.52594  ORF Transcript_31206/g.52594 Transcript_31206/m.52594 type:complete len:466 (+) Transcript_31206:447-1844(+)